MRDQRSTYVLLILIFILAVAVRLYPLTQYPIWGSDFGEHYALTQQLFETGALPETYYGWGLAYPYFPGAYAVTALAAAAGLDLITAALTVTPVISALSVFVIYAIAVTVFRDARIGLGAALILAVSVPLVYSTSHFALETPAHTLALLCVLFFLRSYDDRRYVIPLVLATLALVMTHHLSTYMLLIAFTGAVVLREFLSASSDRRALRFEVPYLVFFGAAVFYYWLIYAIPFRTQIVLGTLPFLSADASTAVLALLALLGAGAIVALVIARRRFFPAQSCILFDPAQRQDAATVSRQVRAAILTTGLIGSIMLIVIAFGLPAIEGAEVQPLAALVFVPYIAVNALGLAFWPALRRYRHGFFVFAWLLSLGLSFLLGLVTQSTTLIYYRHLPFLAAPLALLAGLGIVSIFDTLPPVTNLRRRALALAFTAIIIASVAPTYATGGILGNFDESYTDGDVAAAQWMRDTLPEGSFVATDHGMSSLLFGLAGMNCTWGEHSPLVFTVDTFAACRAELEHATTPFWDGEHRIDYVLIDERMRRSLSLSPWASPQPMSMAALEKFDEAPFVLLYDKDGVSIYAIDWAAVTP